MNGLSQFFKGTKPGASLGGLKHLILMATAIILLLFITTPAVAGTILTTPTGGEALTVGETYDIKWNAVSIPFGGSIDLDLSTDSGVTWTAIQHGISITSQKYAWTVPNSPTTKARVKITLYCDTLGLSGGLMPTPTTVTSVCGVEESADFTIKSSLVILNLKPVLPLPVFVSAPSNLTATTISSSQIDLAWTDKSNNETEFVIERKTGSGSYEEVGTVDEDKENYSDKGLTAGTAYTYRVKAAGNGSTIHDSSYSNESSATTNNLIIPIIPIKPVIPPVATEQTVIRYYIGAADYYVNDQIQTMDTVPIIIEGRTLLPIRYVAEPLGASVDWDSIEQKVTVTLSGKTIEVWVNNNMASVDGVATPIDPNNANVVPIVVPPGRTMLPLRFIAENLGCQVDWNQSLQEVKVTYPKL
ncbi:MAG: hypothetical protein A4E53_03099 [Pelotomaculum sp. PtaB.Bin104]|nr:MAG: hypothetical protein A4E53_03099 [Pelotomaculum sp. PtaB.Bin104]